MRRLPLLALGLAGCLDFNQLATCPANTECGKPPPDSLELAAELEPPAASALVAQEVPRLSFDARGAATVKLVARTTIAGRVLGEADAPVPAQVIVSWPSLIPGRGDQVVQTTTAVRSPMMMGSEGPEPGSFLLAVPAGEAAATVTVIPLDPADRLYAPATWPVNVSQDQALTLCLGGSGKACPSPSSPALAVRGRLADAVDNPLPGVRITAADLLSGAARSSVAITGAGGEFELHLSPNVGPDHMLRLTAVPDAKSALPTLQSELRAGTADPVVLRMPALPAAQRFSLPIGGRSTNGVDVPLAGARVELRTRLTQANLETTTAQFSITVLTDDRGLATVDLIPGTNSVNRTYTVVVVPPADSMFARSTFTVDVPAKGGGLLGALSLGLRPLVRGKVVDPAGKSVRGAVVSARTAASDVHLGRAGADDVSTAMAVTGADGTFVLRLDRGTYDVELIPPANEPLVRWSIDNRAVMDDLVDLGALSLPRAVRTRVAAVAPDGSPAQEVEIRVFAISWSTACADGATRCALPPRLRGDGVTAFDGVAAVLLPAP